MVVYSFLSRFCSFLSVLTQLGRGRGTPLPLMPTQELLVDGPFRYCRNPMTMEAVLTYLGIGIAAGTPRAPCSLTVNAWH